MANLEKKLMTSKMIQERCSKWVESQKDYSYSEEDKLEELVENSCENWYNTDSEFDSVSECGGRKRKVGTLLKNEILDLTCEWKECTFRSDHLDRFLKHVSSHLPHIQISKEDDNDVYVCQWKDCPFNSDISDDIMRHVNYHAYHTKLKCIGSNVRGRTKLPRCRRDPEWRNIIDSPPLHLCRWEECLKMFTNYQMYLYHVTAHVINCPHGNGVKNRVDCKWTGCTGKYNSLYKLREHLRRHTKEKIVACPDCGATFASNTKFHIHCQRQIPLEGNRQIVCICLHSFSKSHSTEMITQYCTVQGFQCSHCNKFYPTERILRDHMRFHVFNYKCSLCDMSCESPASLAKHVRYRHVSTRTYPCQLCSHAAKSQQDLDSHMTVHTNGPNFSCSIEGCRYTCKGAYTLDRHIERAHGLETRWYCCHECPIKYQKSYRLTKHLIETHQLQLPSGHKRFHYIRDQDGCYRLQMVRYEAVDEENISPVEEAKLPDTKYKIEIYQKPTSTELKIVEDNTEEETNIHTVIDSKENTTENEVNTAMPIVSNILISIDEKGNIIKGQLIETQETNELPLSAEPSLILT